MGILASRRWDRFGLRYWFLRLSSAKSKGPVDEKRSQTPKIYLIFLEVNMELLRESTGCRLS
jgi:hypothetical protein